MNTKFISRFDISVVALALMAMSEHTSAAADYRYIDLGPGTAYDINNSDQVVGSDGMNAVVWNGTNKTVLGPGAAHGINDIGQVVGAASSVPVLWDRGTAITAITLPDFENNYGYKVTNANDINNAGNIIGSSRNDCCPHQDVYWKNYTSTPTLIGGKISEAAAINNKGQIVVNGFPGPFIQDVNNINNTRYISGDASVRDINDTGSVVGFFPGTESQAALWLFSINNEPIPLNPITGYRSSEPTAINNTEEVVGVSFNGFEVTSGHATLWSSTSNRAPVDLNIFLPANMAEAGWTLTQANEINDSGLIIGEAYNSRFNLQHAFVLSPVPEPETYALLLAGLGMICFLRYRRVPVTVSGNDPFCICRAAAESRHSYF
jgi:hypothetical protein